MESPGREEMKTMIAILILAAMSMNTIKIEKSDAPAKPARHTVQTMFHNADSQLSALDAEGY